MTPTRWQIAEELASRVVSELGPVVEAIVLYGSVARQEDTEESDIDLLVVLKGKQTLAEETARARDRVSWLRTQLDLGHGTVTRLVFVTPEAFQYALRSGDPFWESIAREGIPLQGINVFTAIRKRLAAAS